MGTGGGVIRTSHTYTTTTGAHCQPQVPPCKTGDIQGKGCIFTKGKLALAISLCTKARRQHIPRMCHRNPAPVTELKEGSFTVVVSLRNGFKESLD